MNRQEIVDLAQKICDHFGVKMNYNPNSAYLFNSAACYGSNEIAFGHFDDTEDMLVSIFHELGHTRKCTHLNKLYAQASAEKSNDELWFLLRYGREYRAWKWGVRAMRLLGLEVTPFMLSVANRCLETYNRTNEYGTRPEGFTCYIVK